MPSADVEPDRATDPRSIGLPDVALAAGVVAFLNLGTYFGAYWHGAPRQFDVWTAILLAGAGGALAWRRRRPVAVLAAVFAFTLLYFVLGYPNGPIWIALIVAYFTAIVRGHRLAGALAAVAGVGTFPWLDHLVRGGPGPSPAGMAALAAWLIVLLGAAEAVRVRRERRAEAVRIEQEEALRRRSEERLRIARELHDALGHHLSLINVQSGVALHLNDALPDQVRSSLSAIKQASKEALEELRSVLEILRQDGEAAPRSPTSTLARLDDLVSQAAAAGLQVRTETAGPSRPLPFGVDVAAFRIVQEALTNVTRHAGTSSATVRLTYGERDLSVEVDDDGRGSDGNGPSANGEIGGGRGITGMHERAAALGGDLEAGPRPGGGFRVRARLPLDRAG